MCNILFSILKRIQCQQKNVPHINKNPVHSFSPLSEVMICLRTDTVALIKSEKHHNQNGNKVNRVFRHFTCLSVFSPCINLLIRYFRKGVIRLGLQDMCADVSSPECYIYLLIVITQHVSWHPHCSDCIIPCVQMSQFWCYAVRG